MNLFIKIINFLLFLFNYFTIFNLYFIELLKIINFIGANLVISQKIFRFGKSNLQVLLIKNRIILKEESVSQNSKINSNIL